MGRFQEEIAQIRRENAGTAGRDPAVLEEHRRAAACFAEEICDQIRRAVKREAREGRIRYDVREGTAFSSQKQMNPHYAVTWMARCDLAFSGDTFHYDPKCCEFLISETETLCWLLNDVQQRLAEDDIYPVEHLEEPFGFRKQHTRTATVRRDLRESARDAQKMEETYANGGHANASVVVGSAFAYFIKE